MARIMVIDDSGLSRGRTSKILQDAGHETVCAENGAVGLDLLGQATPDCIVLDMLMPVMDGLEFLRRLRGAGSTIPVLVQSADIQTGTRALCEQLGISGFLNKPSKADELCRRVAEITCQKGVARCA